MTKEELQKKIAALKQAIASPASNEVMKRAMSSKLADLEADLAKLDEKKEPAKAPAPAKKAPAKKEAKAQERYYIEFLNKAKRFQKDKKYFATYAAAEAWAKKEFEKFHPDMIKVEAISSSKKEPAKKEPVKKATKKEPEKKTPASKEPISHDCDDLIAKEKERRANLKAAAEARANAPKHTPATKNKMAIEKVAERVTGNVMKRVEKGEVKRPELEKLINETEKLLHSLKAALKKL